MSNILCTVFTIFSSFLIVSSNVAVENSCSQTTYCPHGQQCCSPVTCCPNDLICCDDGKYCCSINTQPMNLETPLNYELPKKKIYKFYNVNLQNNPEMTKLGSNLINTEIKLDLDKTTDLNSDINLQLPRKRIFKFYIAQLPNVQRSQPGVLSDINLTPSMDLSRLSIDGNLNLELPKKKIYKFYYPDGTQKEQIIGLN